MKKNIENVIMAKTGQEKREENGFLNFSAYFSLSIQNKRWLKKFIQVSGKKSTWQAHGRKNNFKEILIFKNSLHK